MSRQFTRGSFIFNRSHFEPVCLVESATAVESSTPVDCVLIHRLIDRDLGHNPFLRPNYNLFALAVPVFNLWSHPTAPTITSSFNPALIEFSDAEWASVDANRENLRLAEIYASTIRLGKLLSFSI